MHSNAVAGQPHPVGHRRRHVDHSRGHRITGLRVAIGDISKLILIPTIAVGMLIPDFLDNLIVTGCCPMTLLAGRDITPTDLPTTPFKLGDLISEADPDGNRSFATLVIPLIQHRPRPVLRQAVGLKPA